MSNGHVAVVGITDQGPTSLMPVALSLVAEAQVLCGGERHLAFFPEHPAERVVIKRDVSTLVERLRWETRPTVVLASGDPSCYGIGPLLTDRLGSNRVSILPNVGAVQLAFARLGVAWHDAAILSAHGRPLNSILPAALIARKAAILTDALSTPAAIARALLAADDEDAQTDVFEHLGGETERHVSGRLSELVDQEFAPLNIMIVRRDQPPRPWPLGLPEGAFAHRSGMITKAEVRAVTLAALRLHERAVLWDIGAGCGSVSIEAAALLRNGRVCAVERDAEQLAHLEANRGRFGAGNVCVVAGEAPQALLDLPDPDAVFIGGSGGHLKEILDASARRLRPGGRVVLNLVALEHVAQTNEWARDQAWRFSASHVSISRSVATAGLTRMEALNPVFVITLQSQGGAEA